LRRCPEQSVSRPRPTRVAGLPRVGQEFG